VSADFIVLSEPEAPDAAYERCEMQDKVRAAIGAAPRTEGYYAHYYGDVTMKQIGTEIGVNESRVSQLHARAINGASCSPTWRRPRDERAQTRHVPSSR
jgi:hypothetical protein